MTFFEPIRPLRCADGPNAAYARDVFGIGRTYYGHSWWPSRSYTIWDGLAEENARDVFVSDIELAVSEARKALRKGS